MASVILVDYFGFEIGKPEIPEPFPRVLVWGNDFFIADDDAREKECKDRRYRMVPGHVITETRGNTRI